MNIAHKMIKLLGTFKLLNENSYIDIVKFQKRTNKELLSPEEYSAPYPLGIETIGRFGKWDYLWSHQAFETGINL